MCGRRFYRSLPYLYASICVLELIAAILLLLILSGNWVLYHDDNLNTTSITAPISQQTFGSLSEDVFIKFLITSVLAFVSEIVPIFTAIVLAFCLSTCCCCCRVRKKKYRHSFLRFLSLTCDCPCYKPRPRLRFIIQITFRTICIILRTSAVIMYGILLNQTSSSFYQNVLRQLLIVTVVSLILPFLTILLDIYHYRIWWAYKPDIDISLPSDTVRKGYSPKHKRFIPYIMTGQFRTDEIGNRECQYGRDCHQKNLQHIVIFHSSDHQPQPRWSSEYPLYIGFHRTKPESAISIAKSDFRPSSKGMLGPGAYFARSTKATLHKIGKEDQTGAWFVAEISMGKVFEVDENSIRSKDNNKFYNADLHRHVQQGQWQENYDTCYFKHSFDGQDEFCIKDPINQIKKWVIVIEQDYDNKVSSYGLDNELYSGICTCC